MQKFHHRWTHLGLIALPLLVALTEHTTAQPQLTLSASDTTLTAGTDHPTITVSAPAGQEPASDLTVNFTFTGSASRGPAIGDYWMSSSTVISAGQSSASTTLATFNWGIWDPDKTAIIKASASGYADSGSLTITITDPDPIPLTLTATGNTVSEGNQIQITVSVPTGGEPENDLGFTLSTGGTAYSPADYTFNSPIILAGQRSASTTLHALTDRWTEGEETIRLKLSKPGYTDTLWLEITLEDRPYEESPNNPPPPDDDDDDDDGGGGGGGGGGGAPTTSTPEAPRNLTALGGDGQAVLNWDAPASDGGAEITDYEYRINVTGRWISIGSTATTHTVVTGLDNGTTYVFQVRAVNRIGKGRVSNRAEATPEVFTLDFAHFANGDGIASDLVFVNVGTTQPIRPALYFYDKEGHLIAAESVVDLTDDLEIQEDGSLSIQTAMEPLGELTIATHGRGELVSGSVRVVAFGPIGGVLRFDLPHIGEAGVGVSLPVRDAVFPIRRQEAGINTGVAIHNLESSPEIVRCELMREGVMHDAVSIPLEANGQSSWFIDQAFPAADTSDFAGAVRCDAVGPGQFTAVVLELDAASRIFTTLPVLPVRRAGGRAAELNFAHFANGDGIASDLVFVNLSTERSRPAPTPFHSDILPLRPALYFYDTEGQPIAAESVVEITGDLEVREDGSLTVRAEMEPLGVLTIATHGRGELVSGSVKVVSSGPLGGMLRYHLPEVGVGVAGSSPPLSDALFPVRRQKGGINTGVAVHNLGEEAMEVTCELMQGGTVRDAVSIPLAANGQSSWFIDEVFTGADTSDFAGAVRCTAPGEGMFTGVAVELDAANRIFTTLPVVPVPERPDRE